MPFLFRTFPDPPRWPEASLPGGKQSPRKKYRHSCSLKSIFGRCGESIETFGGPARDPWIAPSWIRRSKSQHTQPLTLTLPAHLGWSTLDNTCTKQTQNYLTVSLPRTAEQPGHSSGTMLQHIAERMEDCKPRNNIGSRLLTYDPKTYRIGESWTSRRPSWILDKYGHGKYLDCGTADDWAGNSQLKCLCLLDALDNVFSNVRARSAKDCSPR